MIEKLENILEEYEKINKLLMSEEIASDYTKQLKYIKKQKTLEEIVNKYKEYISLNEKVESLKELMSFEEFREEAEKDLALNEEKILETKEELKVLLIPKDENDDKDIIMEIRGAAGGDEANIFAGDLYRMYYKYFEKEKFKIEIISESESTSGGFSHIEFKVNGDNVYSKLKYESGAHRVQRVPTTETQGRVHTSTATVLVIPERDDIDIELKDEEIRVDVYRSSGKGGQGVNTTDSAVRLTHIPTNTVVTCQSGRSQIKNKEEAMQILKAKIYELEVKKMEEQNKSLRQSKIKTGDRSEKIRTYNYPQNRITDHRINFTTNNLDKVMDGSIEEIIEALTLEDIERKMINSE